MLIWTDNSNDWWKELKNFPIELKDYRTLPIIFQGDWVPPASPLDTVIESAGIMGVHTITYLLTSTIPPKLNGEGFWTWEYYLRKLVSL